MIEHELAGVQYGIDGTHSIDMPCISGFRFFLTILSSVNDMASNISWVDKSAKGGIISNAAIQVNIRSWGDRLVSLRRRRLP
jgi:hypothetical protein